MDLNEAKKNIETAKRIIGRETEDPGSIWFGIAKSMVGIAEWAVGLTEAYDKIQANTQTRLTMVERLSAERNEARLAELAEVNRLRGELETIKRKLETQAAAHDDRERAWIKATASSEPLFAESAIDSWRDKLDAQTKLAAGLQETIDRLAAEQAEREKAFRDGKLVERLANILQTCWENTGGTHSSMWKDIASKALSELAQMPVELPSADDISAAWDREIDAFRSLNPVARQSYVMHGLANWMRMRLAPLLTVRQMSKIELPICEDIKLAAQVANDEDKLRRAISTARTVHDRGTSTADGTCVILGSLISAVELLASRR